VRPIRHWFGLSQKHLDFVVCSRTTLSPVLAIELDDRSHERPDRRARDEFVDAALRAANLPLERVPVRGGYAMSDIRAMIDRRVSPASVPTAPSTPSGSSGAMRV